MNKKKGFTLVELLAVIVILAIVLLIAVPMVMGIIENVKKDAFKNSAYGIIDAAEIYYAQTFLQGNLSYESFQLVDGKMVNSSGKELVFHGEKPKSGSIVEINDKGQIKLKLTNGTYFATKEFDETAVLISEREGDAPTRDELALQISELKKELDNLKATTNSFQEGSNTQVRELQQELDGLKTSTNSYKEDSSTQMNGLRQDVDSLKTATTVASTFLKSYPVGSIYVSTKSENPGTTYGGTWERYGNGRALVGVDESQTEFNTVGKTGGEKTHLLTIAEMPSHNHNIGLRENNAGTVRYHNFSSNYAVNTSDWYTVTEGNYVLPAGGSKAHNNLQPYITVYMWKRVS